ncbi:hypothetical protein G3570_04720 [Balneolaceae bacterium YR4-1]|uniref:Uncharacterized protein n=1 Tax=Halalkalibaculum roseum TaxID=2709311 RepID=A0A6M1T1J9_9BACT|nr:hypothetical protein [Halalkalibaculum roseum]NGP75925.1 hypothetical protein [Halalkalibaculum roseum]
MQKFNSSIFLRFSQGIEFSFYAAIFFEIIYLIKLVGELNLDIIYYLAILVQHVALILIFYIVIKKNISTSVPKYIFIIYFTWLVYNVLNLIRGAYLSNTYLDWRFLVLTSFPFVFLSLVFYIGNNPHYLRRILIKTLKVFLPLSFVFIPLAFYTNKELFSRIVEPVTYLILFIPYLKNKWKYLIISVALVSVFLVVDYRANLIRIFLSFLILSIYYFPKIFNLRLIKVSRVFLFFLPLIIASSALLFNYNVFNELSQNDSLRVTNKHGESENILSDSRTFIYAEVIASVNNSGNWLFGEGASGSYHSDVFYDRGGGTDGVRYASEVNILNLLLHGGLVGVFIHFMLLFSSSKLFIEQSNNRLCVMFGILFSSKWLMSFIEEFTRFGLNFFFFWLLLGFFSTYYLRRKSDDQLKKFLSF